MSSEFDPTALQIDPCYSWNREIMDTPENRAVRTALTLFIAAFELDEEDCDFLLRPAIDGVADAVIESLTYDRYYTEPIPIAEGRRVIVDQLYMLGDRWHVSSNIFSLTICHEDAEDQQYLFRLQPNMPLNGEVFCGYALDEAHRLSTWQLSQLQAFLDELTTIVLFCETLNLMEYPQLQPDTTEAGLYNILDGDEA